MADDLNLSEELLDLLGEDEFFQLVDTRPGIRTYIAQNIDESDLLGTLSYDAYSRLAKAYGRLYIRVPLAREFRARRYLAAGMTLKQVALKLGMTETGVSKIIRRAKVQKKPVQRPSRKDPRQYELL